MSYVSTLRINLVRPPGWADGQQNGGLQGRVVAIVEKGSQGTSLHRVVPPVFSRSLCDCSVKEGNDVILEGMVKGTSPINVSWLHNGQPVQFGKASYRLGVVRLVIDECLPEDAGVYTCVVANGAGKTSSTAAVMVTDLEISSKGHVSQMSQFGLQYQNGRDVRSTTLTQNCNSLPVTPANGVETKCRSQASNGAAVTALNVLPASCKHHPQDGRDRSTSETETSNCGSTPASPASDSVTPKRKPLKSVDSLKLLDPVTCVEVKVGKQAELYCGILGSPPIAASWVKQKKQVCSDLKTAVETTECGSRLVIQDVEEEDAGCYTLFVRDRTGSIQHQINLAVVDRPQPPVGKPYVSAVRPGSLTLSWSGPSYDGGCAVQSYVVEVRRAGEAEWRTLTDSCLSTSYRVQDGLDCGSTYQFRVRATNAHGMSEPSEESAVITMSQAEDEDCEEPFEYRTVEINCNEDVSDLYTKLEKLGVGKFGQVYKLEEKATGNIRAGKFYKTRTAKERESARMEVELMNRLHHPKLVQCVVAYQSRTEMVMVLEYIAGGELFERIVDDAFEHTEPTCVQYMRQILEGVQYMHRQSIVHLDLKPENIVCVNKTGTRIKIIDFGLARALDQVTPVKVMQGTAEFVAPEVIAFEAIDFTTDMWSIGVICYILLSGDSPFQGSDDMETFRNVTAAQWDFDEETFSEISDQAKDFISRLLQKNMKNRMTSDQALEHRWLQEMEAERGSTKTLSKERIKKFLARQKWQKTGKAVLALKRMSLLTNRLDNKGTSPDSPQKEEFSYSSDDEVFTLLRQQIQQAPSFSTPLRDQAEVEGSSACLQCHIEGYPDPEVIWLYDGIPVQESSHFRIEYEENGRCALVVSDVSLQDSGCYTCRACNELGEAECSAKLTVSPLHGVRKW
ncbi:myosin light chain kinase, smooth muscle isoform X1 [Microcaecilia unicolor]|uniref:Myosin light chain kinase, smooth muscle-like isoform X1 n=2 Tax=Microcaecilia unicolor TaxID=1415580 RepID=A0A6P7ZUT0_9AMPH|nr:myosin light chain kinase, smooth muscle-like isoform X1 [Microcaecilia unicolor]